MNTLPPLISKKGEINHTWVQAYMQQQGVPYKEAHVVFNNSLKEMPEPPPALGSGKPNPVWVTWFRLRRRYSPKASLAACKLRIEELKEQNNG